VDIPKVGGKARPDLMVGSELWVEVETLRVNAPRGSNPFFALASKLGRKVEAMRQCKACWLLVPSDLALLATPQLLGVARNLGLDSIKFGYLNLETRRPVFIDEPVPEPEDVRVHGTPWRSATRQLESKPITLDDIAGYARLKRRIEEDVVHPLINPDSYRRRGLSGPNGLLLYGLPGCGKSLMGKALAGRAEIPCRKIVPSDLTSKWLGEGVEKIRDLFDWALRQTSCLLVIDELDGIAPQRSEGNMHADDKRQVNELLTQLDRVAGKSVTVIATTNYMRGIDSAIRRSGRFDIKIPVFPPSAEDREEIFAHYLRRSGSTGVDTGQLARESRLFTPSDIRTVVEMAMRRAIRGVADGDSISLKTEDVIACVHQQHRSIQPDDARKWLEEAACEIPASKELEQLHKEVSEVFGDTRMAE
jgi:ATP-dependent 26S proteasome regulatory subunit